MRSMRVRTEPDGTAPDGRAVTRTHLIAPDGSGVALLDLGAADPTAFTPTSGRSTKAPRSPTRNGRP